MKRKNIETAIEVLREAVSDIDRVSEWAAAMGYDNHKTFSRHIRNRFGKRPKKLMADIKLDILKNILNQRPDITFYEAALLIGKKDEQALYHFVKQQTGHPPSHLRMEKNNRKK